MQLVLNLRHRHLMETIRKLMFNDKHEIFTGHLFMKRWIIIGKLSILINLLQDKYSVPVQLFRALLEICTVTFFRFGRFAGKLFWVETELNSNTV
jgi:hypothetical protein